MLDRGHEFSPPPLIKDDFVRIASLRKSWDDRPIVGAVVVLGRVDEFDQAQACGETYD